MKVMFLQHNDLHDLPKSMNMLKKLTSCNLAHNRFEGTPPQFFEMKAWVFCDMTGNETEDAKSEEKQKDITKQITILTSLMMAILRLRNLKKKLALKMN